LYGDDVVSQYVCVTWINECNVELNVALNGVIVHVFSEYVKQEKTDRVYML